MPSLVEIGPVVLKKKSKRGKVYRRTDRQTDGRTDGRKDGRRTTSDQKTSSELKRSCHKKWPCAIKKLKCVIFRNKNQCQFLKKWSNVKVKRISTNKMILSHSIFIWNIKALALSIQISLTRSNYLIRGQTPRSRSQGHKVTRLVPTEITCIIEYSCEITKL